MTEYPMSGALFKNKDKTPDNNFPDYQGKANIGGIDMWISAWIKKPNGGGETFISLSFKYKNAQGEDVVDSQAPIPESDLDDDIPFSFALPLAMGLSLISSIGIMA